MIPFLKTHAAIISGMAFGAGLGAEIDLLSAFGMVSVITVYILACIEASN
jgi:hypothetical protein